MSAPGRRSLFAIPAALAAGAACLVLFYFAVAPVTDPRAGSGAWLRAVLGVAAAGVPAAGFWGNRAFFREAQLRQRARGATLVVAESALFLAALLFFANFAVGGYGEAGLIEKADALANAGADARKQIERYAAERGTLARSGEAAKLEVGARAAEAILGADGAIVVYDGELHALAAMIPALRGRNVDWRLEGYPAKIFPEHWRTAGRSSLDAEAPGTATEHSQALLKIATQLQYEISAEAKKRGATRESEASHTLSREGVLDFGYVDADGAFALYSDRHGVFMVFEPQLKDGLVHWRCRVYPPEAAVPGCASGAR